MLAFDHSVYGRCYVPYYNIYIPLTSVKPEIYNALGERMDIFFLRDASGAHLPYGNNQKVKDRYFLWDRFNFALDTHFYTDACVGEIIRAGGNNQRNYALLQEPKSIISRSYELFYENKDLANEFQKVMTHDEKLLDTLPNAMLYNACACMLCYCGDDPLRWSNEKYKEKCRLISMVISGKEFTPLHLKRNALAKQLVGRVDLFGNFVNNYIQHKSTALETYCYHIALENEQNKYYFTEKIMDCFISMAIPLYLGATTIGEFFNLDGIIVLSEEDISDIDRFNKILAQCTLENYVERLPAIIDNYNRSLRYLNPHNRLYEEVFLHQGN